MIIEDTQHLCPAGSLDSVPKGVPHTFKVVSSGSGVKPNLFTPAAMVDFFRDLAAGRGGGHRDPGDAGRDRQENQIEVLAPVPDTYL